MVVDAGNADLGRKVKEAAKEAGLSLIELGELMGVSRPTIYAYASGALKISSSRIEQIATLTGKPVTHFLPKTPEHLPERSQTASSFRLIDALLSPANPVSASNAAKTAIKELGSGVSSGIRAELIRKAGNALAMAGEYIESVRQLELARNLFEPAVDSEKIGSCLQTLGFCYTSLGNLEQAQSSFEQASDLLAPEQKWKAEVALAALSERKGAFDEAESRLSKMLDDPSLSDVPLAYVRANYASIVCARGRWKSGLAQTETALEAAYAANLTDQVAELLVQAATACLHLNRLPEATLLAMRAKDVSFTLQDEARITLAEVTVARILLAYGETTTARTVAANAYSRAIRGQYRRSESQALQVLAELALVRGDFETAIETANQISSHAKAHGFLTAQAIAELIKLRSGQKANATVNHSAINQILECESKCGIGQMTVLALEAQGLIAERNLEPKQAVKYFEAGIQSAQEQELGLDANRLQKRLSSVGDSGGIASNNIGNHYLSQDVWINILSGKSIENVGHGSGQGDRNS